MSDPASATKAADETTQLARLATEEYHVWTDRWGGSPGVRVEHRPDITIRDTDLDHPFLNLAYRARIAPTDVPARIADVVAILGRDGRTFNWGVWPGDRPADLVDRLMAVGFVPGDDDPLMIRRIGAGPERGGGSSVEGLRIVPAVDAAAIDAVTAFVTGEVGGTGSDDGVFAATFRRLASGSDPRLRLFGGWVDGRLVASAGLFSGAAVAGIVAVMTVPSMRGRGIGGGMTLATMDAAQTLGFDTAILRASTKGERLYRHLGFREVGRVVQLRWPGGGATVARGDEPGRVDNLRDPARHGSTEAGTSATFDR